MITMSPRDGFSRRRFVSGGAASVFLPTALAKAQTIPPNAPLPPDEAAKIAAERDAASHLTVGVMIDGKGPFRFVVDTGADRSVIADDVAAALGLPIQQQVMVAGVVLTIPAETVRVGTLSFGPIARNDLTVPILPRALLRADGYLGLDAIDGSRVTFDFKNRALMVASPYHRQSYEVVPPEEARVRVIGEAGHLRSVNCRADGVRTTTFIDTGAEISVGNAKLLSALMEIDPTYLRLETVPLTGVTGGTVQGHITTIKSVHLDSLTFDGCNIVVANLQIFDLWGLRDKPALLIGMNFLREFDRVSIDYGSKELRFDLARLVLAQRA